MSSSRLALPTFACLLAACGADVTATEEIRGGPGDRCEIAIPIELSPELVPTRVENDTTTLKDDLTLAACADDASTAGQGSGDVVYRVRTSRAALYRFTIEGAWPAPTALALATDCGAFATAARASCLASSPLDTQVSAERLTPTLEARLEADTDYFLVVDGLAAVGRPDEGPFALQIGCGCAADETCEPSGACRPRQPGDACDLPLTLTAPVPFTQPVKSLGSTLGQPDSALVPAACTPTGTSFGAQAPDRVHTFTAPVTGRYEVTLTSTDGARLGLAAFAGCATSPREATCVASATTPAPSPDAPDLPLTASLTLDLAAGDTAALLVDGLAAAGPSAGVYELAIAPPCVPSCARCGEDDGCGRTCGCESGEYCDAGACVPDDLREGNTCSNPRPLDANTLPIVQAGDTSAASGLGPSHDALGCPGVAATGAHVTDEVWRFTAPSDGDFEVRVFPTTPTSDPLVYAFAGTACAATDCRAYADAVAAPVSDPERLILRAAAGDELSVVVGAWRPEAAGPYRLEIDRACATSCTRCGEPDGCGGTCGCPDGHLCEDGACTAPETIAGDTCTNPLPLIGPTLPFGASGDIGPGARVTANHSAHACDAFVTGGSSPDQVWSFEAPSAGRYDVIVTPTGPRAADTDLMVYAFTDAACATDCAGFTDAVHTASADPRAPEHLTLEAQAPGARFLLVVDAWTPELAGAYTITARVACTATCQPGECGGPDGCGGTCGCGPEASCRDLRCVADEDLPGNTCAAPFPLRVSQPARGDLGAADALADLSPTCSGAVAAGPDQVFRFVAPASGAWTFTATPDAPMDLVVYAYAAGDCGGACLGLGDRAPLSASPESLRLEATAGESFDLVVDGYAASTTGAFTLTAAPACAPQCEAGLCGGPDGCGGTCGCGEGEFCRADACVAAATIDGDTCARPRELTGLALPYLETGDLASFGALSDDLDASTCAAGASGVGAPDEVWSFVAPEAGLWEITATPEPGGLLGDLVLYAFDGASCDGACSMASDEGGPEAPERLLLDARAGQRFTIVVDAWLAQTTDRYTIRAGRPCTPSCEPGRCGDDGCGGTCGCASDEVCGPAATCVEAQPGDTCATAGQLGSGALPWSASGDVGPSSGRTDALSPRACGATGLGRDQTWSALPPAGTYELVVRPAPGVDVAVFTYAGASCGAGCTRYIDAGPGDERLTLVSDGVTPHWITVEAIGAGGAFTVTLSAPCAPSCGSGCGEPDGCGGICGCASGAVCVADTGQCVAASSLPGNTCASPRVLEGSGDHLAGRGDIAPTATLGDELDASACGEPLAGRGGLDEVWRFVPPSSGDWELVARADGQADLMLYAFGDAACSTCLGFTDEDQLGGGRERLRLRGLVGGQAVRVVVDSFAASAGGAYTLEAHPACDPTCAGPGCGEDDGCGGTCGCAAGLCDADSLTCVAPEAALGNSCERPRPIAVGGTEAGDLADATFLSDLQNTDGCPDYPVFDGSGGPDEVFFFVAPTTGLYTLRALPEPGADVMLYAFDDAACSPASCLLASDRAGLGAEEELTVPLVAGATVRVVVDTWAPSAAGAYTLSVEGP